TAPRTDPPPVPLEKNDTVPTAGTPLALVPDKKSSGAAGVNAQSPEALHIHEVELQVERGTQWLANMNGVNGPFVHGVLPDLNRALYSDDYIHQLEATVALARAA